MARAFGSRVVVAAVVVGAVVLVAPVPALAAGDANQATCPFETEASPGFRTYLPDCRAYELVTPPYKAGGVVLDEPGAISADGEHVIVGVGGAFAGAGNDWWDGNRNPDIAVYELTRTAAGWQPTALTPPAAQYPHSTIMAASTADGLATTLWGAATSTLLFNEDIYLRQPDGAFVRVGPGVAPEVADQELSSSSQELNLVGASSDLTRSLFQVTWENPTNLKGHSNLWPGDTTKEGTSLYEYVYNGAPSPEPILVGVKNPEPLKSDTEAQLISSCGTELGTGEKGSAYNAVSESGETVFFTAHACGGPGEPTVDELYARVDGASTTAISEPTAADCSACNTTTGLQNAVFQGASDNGEKVFFLTEQELLPGQKGMNLYEYDFNGPAHAKISLVSGGSTEPKVSGVVRVSEYGERVYFVAKGKLAGMNAEDKEPEEEADNLYVYEPDPAHPGAYHTVFVAKLLSPAEETALSTEESAEASEVGVLAEGRALRAAEEALSRGATFPEAIAIDSEVRQQQEEALRGTLGPAGTLAEDKSVWELADTRPAQATPDEGQFLLFPSSADLTPGDDSKVPQLFEYDALTEGLTRVSIGQGGTYGDNGNVDTYHGAPHIPAQFFRDRDLPTEASFGVALSKDGSRVFFTSAAHLTPQAEDGSPNVFEYHAGDVYLISDGRDTSVTATRPTVSAFGIDPSGQNAFFTTADPLVPQDGETQEALYDAREAGGFPAPLVSPGCAGETCRGATGGTPQLVSPGSAGQLAGENVPPPVESKPAARSKAKPLTRAQKLAKALKTCRAKRNKTKRAGCEAQARKKYGAKSKSKAATSNRRHRKAGR